MYWGRRVCTIGRLSYVRSLSLSLFSLFAFAFLLGLGFGRRLYDVCLVIIQFFRFPYA